MTPLFDAQFEKFFRAADREALALLRNRGVSRESGADPQSFYSAVETLAKFARIKGEPADAEGYEPMPLPEALAQIDASYMLGLAMGVRLGSAPVEGVK